MARTTPTLPRLCISACGKGGAGKTDFALTVPDVTPWGEGIEVFSLDANTEEIVAKHKAAGKNITLHDDYTLPTILDGSRDHIQSQAEPIWLQLLDDMADVVRAKSAAAIVLDTGTIAYDLFLTAEHGKLDEIPQLARVKTNMRFENFLIGLRQSKMHVVLLHRLGDLYEGKDRVEGKYRRRGCANTEFAINLEVFLYHDPEREGAETLEDQFGMEVVRCTTRPAVIGEERWGTYKSGNRKVSFKTLAKLVYPDYEW